MFCYLVQTFHSISVEIIVITEECSIGGMTSMPPLLLPTIDFCLNTVAGRCCGYNNELFFNFFFKIYPPHPNLKYLQILDVVIYVLYLIYLIYCKYIFTIYQRLKLQTTTVFKNMRVHTCGPALPRFSIQESFYWHLGIT